MPSYYHRAIVVLTILFSVNVKCHQNTRTQIWVGFLPAIKGDLKERQGLAISGAMTLALEKINKSPDILPNVELKLSYNDTRGDVVQSTRAITEMICDGVSAIFGPEGASCYVEAIVAQSRNIPMLAYVRTPHESFLIARLYESLISVS
jgi:guanylate cyclase, other